MSHYNINNDDLKDSKSLTKAIIDNIIPRGGKSIEGTSLAERGYAGQTLTSVDLISAASGNELFGNARYGNLFRMNIARENLNSLASTIMDNQLPSVEGLDQASLALRVMTRSGMGLEGSNGLIDDINSRLSAKYGSPDASYDVDGLSHSNVDYNQNTGAATSGFKAVAFEKSLSNEEKAWRVERARLLAQKIKASNWEKSVLINGFMFDIRDNNLSAKYDTKSIVPGSNSSDDRTVAAEIVQAPEQRAYISASLMEFLIALTSEQFGPPLTVNIQFGTHRQDGRKDSNPNVSGSQSGSITDHAFGRAVDIMSVNPSYDQVERKYLKNLSAITTKDGHLYQLNVLLTKMNAMPQHLIPDYIAVSASFVDEAYDTYSSKAGKLKSMYPNLGYLKLKRDESGAHNNHFHISFAPERGGRYVGPNGSLQNAVLKNIFGSSSKANNARFLSADDARARASETLGQSAASTAMINNLSKSYTNNPQQIDPQEIFLALTSIGLFCDEAAAVFVGLANRESSRRLYIVQPTFGALGLWQVSTIPKDGGNAEAVLLHPEKIRTNYWKLALPDLANLTSDSEISTQIRKRCDPSNSGNGIDKFDQRCWNLINQVGLLRSKIYRHKNLNQSITDLPIEPWGDNYLKYGFISSTNATVMSFKDIVDVYQKMTGKSERDLKTWIVSQMTIKKNTSKANVNQKSPTLQIDPENGKTVLDNWFDGKKYPAVHL